MNKKLRQEKANIEQNESLITTGKRKRHEKNEWNKNVYENEASTKKEASPPKIKRNSLAPVDNHNLNQNAGNHISDKSTDKKSFWKII